MTAQWQPGKRYAPGDIVQPRSTDPVIQSPLTNQDFESGDTGWDTGGNWSIVAESPFAGTQAAKFVSGVLLAIGSGDDDDSFAKSTDGITWTTGDVDAGNFFPGADQKIVIAPKLGKWITVREVGTGDFGYQTFDDGVSWSEIVPTGIPDPGSCNALKWFEELSLFFYGHADGRIYTSPDGVAWTLRQDIGGTVWAFDYSPTLGIVVAQTGAAAYWSADNGVTWTAGTAIAAIDVVWATGMSLFVAVQNGSRNIFTSTDGKIWTTHTDALPLGALGSPEYFAYSPTLNRICTSNTALPTTSAFSDDGIAWTLATTKVNLNFADITWDARNSQFVMCENGGTDSSFATTPNGVTWTERTTTYAGVSGWAGIDAGAVNIVNRDVLTNAARLSVSSGQQITGQVFAKITGGYAAHVGISWYNSGGALLSTSWTDAPIVLTGAYRRVSATDVAPDNAATCTVVIAVTRAGDSVFFDNATISHTDPVTLSVLLFKATQASPGFSDSFEPTWPTIVGNTVIDNEVTWEGVPANRVLWQAFPILVSGSSEPTFPAAVEAEVADNTISWQAETRRVEDENCPNTATVAITASKIFSGDKDIVAFSATINPLDWTTANDAGYIPFGLNTYGSQDVSALGLYRSNLVVFNAKAFQMWQVDEDPANFAILDAVPVGSEFPRSLQAVSNDLVFNTAVGIRSMGIAGASTNLQAGFFGKQIDPLVQAKLAAGETPISLYYPGAGQYWLIFGAEAFVLTMNGGKSDMSWSRYIFPSVIDDWTILNTDLYLRSGDKVWRLDETVFIDDSGGANVTFAANIWWPYLDFGALGVTKQMIGFDTVATGTYTVSIGYNQNDDTQFTTPYTIAGDTIPGDVIPIPVSAPSLQLRLVFAGNEAWEWSASSLYLQDFRRTS